MTPAKDLIRRFEELRARRASWEGHWQELAEHVLPRRADVTGPRMPGEKRAPLSNRRAQVLGGDVLVPQNPQGP